MSHVGVGCGSYMYHQYTTLEIVGESEVVVMAMRERWLPTLYVMLNVCYQLWYA